MFADSDSAARLSPTEEVESDPAILQQPPRKFGGLVVAMLASLVIFFGSDPVPSMRAKWAEIRLAMHPSESDRQRHGLAFLKSLYDRLDSEIASGRNQPWAAALRSEQAEVLQRMRIEAESLHGDLPAEIAALLVRPPAAAPAAEASGSTTPAQLVP